MSKPALPSDRFKRLGVAPRKKMGMKSYASVGISKILRGTWKTSPKKAEDLALHFYRGNEARAYMRMFWMLRGMDDSAANGYAIKAVESGAEDNEAIKIYAIAAYKTGDLETVNKYKKIMGRTKRLQKLLNNVKSNLSLLEHGMPMPEYSSKLSFRPIEHRTLYFLHNSLPINSGGYATRAHGLLTGVHKAGFEAIGVTRLGFPHDRGSKYALGEYSDCDKVDGISYHRLLSKNTGLGRMPLQDYLNENIARNGQILRKFRPSIVQGASNFVNGVTANIAAKKHGVMSIYEVRGLWEITRMSREPEYEGTDAFNLYVRMETEACQSADHCFAITQALKDEMVNRGVDEKKITLVQNGVDTLRFRPQQPDILLKCELGYAPDDVVIGYIGSIVDYEGLDYLLQAMAMIKKSGPENLKLLIVGDGDKLEILKEYAAKENILDRVQFTGRVGHHHVEKYYSIIDIVPFPRKGYPVCEMVSPLKPFEAMAMGKAVLVSNVAAMAEFVSDGVNGLIFDKDDHRALHASIMKLYDSPNLRRSLGENGRRFVTKERDWRVLAEKMTNVYHQLLDRRQWLVAQDAKLQPFDTEIEDFVKAKYPSRVSQNEY